MYYHKNGRINWDEISSILKKIDYSLHINSKNNRKLIIDKQNELLNNFLHKYLSIIDLSKNKNLTNHSNFDVPLQVDNISYRLSFFEEINVSNETNYRYINKGSLPLLPNQYYTISLKSTNKNILARILIGNGKDMYEKICFKIGNFNDSINLLTDSRSTWFSLMLETDESVTDILETIEIKASSIHKIIDSGINNCSLIPLQYSANKLNNDLFDIQQSLRKNPDIITYPIYNQCHESINNGTFRNWKKNLRIATIIDEFTYQSYAPEAVITQLTPDNWQKELEMCNPDLLFVESAWKGKDDQWAKRLTANSAPLLNILSWCRDHRVVTVFWNKEDPVHFDLFLPVACLFDVIFTHDQDCVERYKHATNNENVFHLHFGVQPELFNPIEKYTRTNGFSFAGSYYAKYPERSKNLHDFILAISNVKEVDIYDRQQGKGNERLTYPEALKPFLKGGLSYSDIDKAYKKYKYAINMNSFKQSQSQCARRIYELLACNTGVVSNYSRGVRQIFGDLLFCSDDSNELLDWIKHFEENPLNFDKFRLQALRKVMLSDLYEDRLASLICAFTHVNTPDLLPKVVCVGIPKNNKDEMIIIDSFIKQTWNNKSLYLLYNDIVKKYESSQDALDSMTIDEFEGTVLNDEDNWFAVLNALDWYGEQYLTDLMLATRYAKFCMAGKTRFYTFKNDFPCLTDGTPPYHRVQSLNVGSAIMNSDVFREFLDSRSEIIADKEGLLSLDCFNYCQNGNTASDAEQIAKICGDINDIYNGVYKNSNQYTENKHTATSYQKNMLCGQRLYVEFETRNHPLLDIEMDNSGNPVFISYADEDEIVYFYGRTYFPIKDIIGPQKFLSVSAIGDGGAKAFIQYKLYDKDGINLRVGKKLLSVNDAINFDSNTKYIKFDIAVEGFGKLKLFSLMLSNKNFNVPNYIYSGHKNILITAINSELIINNDNIKNINISKDTEIFIYDEESRLHFGKFGQYDMVSGNCEILEKILKTNLFSTIYFDDSVENIEELIKLNQGKAKMMPLKQYYIN